MTRTRTLTIVPALLLLLGVGWGSGHGRGPGSAPRAARGEPADPRVDSARAELAAGRPWHASRLLRGAAATGLNLGPGDVLLLARADADWRNWAGVVEQLAGKPWLDATAGGDGWRLLARAREERREWAAAADAYERWFATPAAAGDSSSVGLRARQARALAMAGRGRDALAALDRAARVPVVASWATLDPAAVAADSGRVDELRALLPRVTDSLARAATWELMPRALLAARDSAAAETAYREAAGTAAGDARRAKAWMIVGDLARARGDAAAARTAYFTSLQLGAAAPTAARAAKGLFELGELSADRALLVARALDRANDDTTALRAFDRHVELAGGAAAVAEPVRLERARILARTKGREDEAVAELTALSTSKSERVGAPALDAWAKLRGRQSRTADATTLEGRLIARYPRSAEAADVVFFRGDARHDRNDLAGALAQYEKLGALSIATDRAGLAAMRAAQIHLLRKETAAAAETWEKYLAAYPGGRRWQESAYWAARARLSLGDSAKARTLIERLRKDDPFSYYTIMAAELLGEPYALDLPSGDAPETPDWLSAGLLRLDQLRAGGLATGAASETERLLAQARAAGAGAMQTLAEALLQRDQPIPAIGLAFEVRRQGAPWTLRLARIVYPWGYREVFLREAREDGIDPLLTAALARQESAFDPDVHSSANAVGLMQLLPRVGAEMARSVGPQGFREEMLEVPDVNVHLGTLHLKGLLNDHQGDITRFLAAYNAGAHRVARWVDFAEAKDPLTFTERIPFAETRDYVKQIRRNLVIYRLLYGSGLPAA